MKKILMVEDDEGLMRGVTFTLEKDGYEVLSATTIAEAKAILLKTDIHLLLLDLNLPDGDGLDLCEWVRKNYEFPIIMLTARDLETDEVTGLLKGANDYIVKPFSLAVLKARVAVNLREKDQVLSCGAIRLSVNRMKAYKNDDVIELSSTEYKILKYFMENQGIILSKEQILEKVWDEEANFVEENTLQVNIRRLRLKLEDNFSKIKYIHTIRNIGYRFDEAR